MSVIPQNVKKYLQIGFDMTTPPMIYCLRGTSTIETLIIHRNAAKEFIEDL